jgi:hypothetical protein
MTREFAEADVSVRVREATSFCAAFIRAENGSSRPGHSRENNCQVLRPSSRTPSSSVRPCRKAQPPAGVPPESSGSARGFRAPSDPDAA